MTNPSEERLGEYIKAAKPELERLKAEFPDVRMILTAYHVAKENKVAPYVIYSDLPTHVIPHMYCHAADAMKADELHKIENNDEATPA